MEYQSKRSFFLLKTEINGILISKEKKSVKEPFKTFEKDLQGFFNPMPLVQIKYINTINWLVSGSGVAEKY